MLREPVAEGNSTEEEMTNRNVFPKRDLTRIKVKGEAAQAKIRLFQADAAAEAMTPLLAVGEVHEVEVKARALKPPFPEEDLKSNFLKYQTLFGTVFLNIFLFLSRRST